MTSLSRIPAALIAAMLMLAFGPRLAESQKALVYCPTAIDASGCSAVKSALGPAFPGGVDGGFDGTDGTVDLKTVDLFQYGVVVVPSLAETDSAAPYALLRDAAVAGRLKQALLGRRAFWSGTPDQGMLASTRTQKDQLIRNLAAWAGADFGTVNAPGLVVLQDNSDDVTRRYSWVQPIAGINIIADPKLASYGSVRTLTAAGSAVLNGGGTTLAYSNMASYGFQTPTGASGLSMDAVGQTGTSVGGQVVLVSQLGANTGGAVVQTDKDDYPPGTPVIMTGSGFAAGETVTLTLHEDPLLHPDRVHTATADAEGRFVYSGFAPEQHDLDVRFVLTAKGQTSGRQAQTTFTDGQVDFRGRVTSAATEAAISGATVTGTCTAGCGPSPESITKITNSNGEYEFKFTYKQDNAITVALSASADGYIASSVAPASYPHNTNKTQDFALTSACTAPAVGITLSPSSTSVAVGSAVQFSANATGSPAPTVQWFRAGTATPIQSGPTYQITSATVADAGTYYAVATNGCAAGGATQSNTIALTVAKGTPTLTWANPADINYGVALGSAQLNATASTTGTFTYTPALGAYLPAGTSQTLKVDFTPTDGANYDPASKTVTINVNPVPLKITASSHSRPYGTANPAFSAAYAGFVNSDDATKLLGTLALETSATANSPVGSYDVTPSGLSSTNYIIEFVKGTLAVTQVGLTVQANSKSRVYGVDNPPLDGMLSGVAPGDNITASYATVATSTSTVGSYPITATLVDPNGKLGNYAVTNTPGTLTITKAGQTITFAKPADLTYGNAALQLTAASSAKLLVTLSASGSCSLGTGGAANLLTLASAGTCTVSASQAGNENYNAAEPIVYELQIAKAQLTVAAGNASRTYGSDNPTFVGTLTGVVASDNITASYATTATQTSGVGTYPIVPALADPDSKLGNYVVSSTNGTLTVNPASLTVTASSKEKMYGADLPALDGSISGFVNGEGSSVLTAQPSYATTATSSSAVGSYAISASGAAAGNYTFTYVPGTLAVTAAPLSVTATSVSRQYGDDNPTFGVQYSGFVLGETSSALNGTLSVSSSAVSTSPVGTYPIVPSGVTSTNYAISLVNGTLTVTPRPATVRIASASRPYGSDNPTFTANFDNLVAGDALSCSYTTVATATSNVTPGGYPISGTCTENGNYTVTVQPGTLTVNPVALSVTAKPSGKVYGSANPAFEVTYGTFVNGEGPSVLGGTLSFVTTATAASDVGSYAVTPAGLTSTNYTLGFEPANLTVTPAPLEVKTVDVARTYGQANPTFTATYSGFVLGQTPAVLSGSLGFDTPATTGSPVGQYDVTPTGLSSTNYQIALVKGILTINPAPLMVTVDNLSKIQGAVMPPLTGAVTGQVNGDAITASYATVATDMSPPGTYAITATLQGPALGNYSVTNTPGTLTVTVNQPPTITAAAAPAPIRLGGSFGLTLTLADADVDASRPYKVSIDWGDGTEAEKFETAVIGQLPLRTHTYAAPGVYTVSVSVTDKVNQTATGAMIATYQYAVVYDPSAGFVTGGGWIDSPKGAYTANTELAGKANFGFVSKYQKGANVPSGHTEFQFHAGNLNFKSSSFAWLVIQGTTQSQFKGTGSINGAGTYNFLVTAIDGDNFSGTRKPDSFRIKITNGSSVVYDNQIGTEDASSATTALSGGSIQIHVPAK